MRRRSLISAIPAAVLLAGTRSLATTAPAQPPTVGIIGGEIDGTFIRVATDLTSVMNSDALRVVPIIGRGSLQNIGDLLNLPGVDLALIATDAFAYAQAEHLYPDGISKIQYVCKLYENDVHVCARPEIQSLADLQGKPVNIDVEGAGTNLTARAIFGTLGITPDFRTEESTIGLNKLQRGDIAANVCTAGKPVRLFATVPADTGLHFLPIESNESLEKNYLPGGMFTHADYPTLIPAGQTIETVGVGVTLAVVARPTGSARYRNLVTFVDTFFTKFPELLKPPHHPRWHDVNLAATEPGWTRFAPATSWLAQHKPKPAEDLTPPPSQAEFEAFLADRHMTNLSPARRAATWEYFQKQQQTPK